MGGIHELRERSARDLDVRAAEVSHSVTLMLIVGAVPETGTGRKMKTRGVSQPRVSRWWTILDLNQ